MFDSKFKTLNERFGKDSTNKNNSIDENDRQYGTLDYNENLSRDLSEEMERSRHMKKRDMDMTIKEQDIDNM